MSRYLMRQTTINITFTIQTDKEIAILNLINLLLLPIFLIRQAWQIGNRVSYEIIMLARDIKEALSFTGKVFSIGFSSLAWGMGLI